MCIATNDLRRSVIATEQSRFNFASQLLQFHETRLVRPICKDLIYFCFHTHIMMFLSTRVHLSNWHAGPRKSYLRCYPQTLWNNVSHFARTILNFCRLCATRCTKPFSHGFETCSNPTGILPMDTLSTSSTSRAFLPNHLLPTFVLASQ